MKIFEKNNADIESVKVHAFRHMPLRAYATLSPRGLNLSLYLLSLTTTQKNQQSMSV